METVVNVTSAVTIWKARCNTTRGPEKGGPDDPPVLPLSHRDEGTSTLGRLDRCLAIFGTNRIIVNRASVSSNGSSDPERRASERADVHLSSGRPSVQGSSSRLGGLPPSLNANEGGHWTGEATGRTRQRDLSEAGQDDEDELIQMMANTSYISE